MRTSLLALAFALLAGLSGGGMSRASDSLVYFGLEVPVVEAPGLNAPPVGASALGGFGNFFTDLVERFGLSAGVYPVSLGGARLGLRGDVMYHYDMDVNRTPTVYGYNHIGLAPSLLLDLAPGIFAQGAFGLNRMGIRDASGSSFNVGTVLEASLGLRLGGFALEGVFQNRSGLTAIRYGLVRFGKWF